MLDARIRPRIDPLLDAFGRRLLARGIRADAVTVAGFGLGLVAIACTASGAFLAGLGFFLLNRLCDGVDGALARLRGITDLGGFVDIVLDFLIYAGMVFAFAAANPATHALPAAFLLWSFMGTGSSFLAFAIFAAKRGLVSPERGTKSFYYLGGLAEGSETILFLVLCALFPDAFPALAWSFAGLCWLTTLGRIGTALRSLRNLHPAPAGSPPGP